MFNPAPATQLRFLGQSGVCAVAVPKKISCKSCPLPGLVCVGNGVQRYACMCGGSFDTAWLLVDVCEWELNGVRHRINNVLIAFMLYNITISSRSHVWLWRVIC